jgi:hypothetical protein
MGFKWQSGLRARKPSPDSQTYKDVNLNRMFGNMMRAAMAIDHSLPENEGERIRIHFREMAEILHPFEAGMEQISVGWMSG